MTSVASETTAYRTLREACGVLDCSERGKLALSGPDAKPFLQGQVTNDVEALSEGEGCYAAFLTPKGKMLGDMRILDASGELLLDTERVALQELFNMIRRHKVGYRVELHKRTLERGLLCLIGPASDEVAGTGDLPTVEHSHAPLEIAGVAARAIRTEAGVDLLCDAADIGALLGVVEARGAVQVPESAVDVLRVERGSPRYGIDLDETVIPQEAGLNRRAVSFTKGCYVGQETVARLHYRGKPNRNLRGLALSAAADRGAELRMGERSVGTLTTVASSPAFGSIGLALVRREAPPGTTVSVLGDGGVTAEVVELPFEN